MINIVTAVISSIAIAYAIKRFIGWFVWYRRGEKFQIDLNDDDVIHFDKLAYHTNLSRNKVAEVVIIHALMKMIEKEERND